MNEDKFKDYLIEKLDVEPNVLEELFAKEVDVFKIAFELIEKHGIDEKKLGKIWGDYLGFAYVDPNSSIVNKDFVNMLGAAFVRENNALPLYKFGKAVTVCTSNPQNPFIQNKMEKKLNEIVSFVFCFPFDIEIYLQFNNIK
jgi:hypothetical protein